MENDTEYEKYKQRMERFPCAFNLVGADKVTTAKLRTIQHNLDSELEINDNCENERIIKLNLLTWVRFRLDKQDEAVQLSNEVVESTERKNIASLGNRFFVMWQTGDEFEATTCLENLEKMESEHGFDTQRTDAEAEQAYYYSRLGGLNNLQRAIQIYASLPETSINNLRNYGRGLVHHRITHANIYCSSTESLPMRDYQQTAGNCFFEVACNAESRLRSLAYAQLVNLRRCYPHKLSPEDHALFRGLGVMQLCEKALEHGDNIPTVLTQCGKAIKPINLDKGIEWLKKSVELKENSTAYHHLGICCKRKAQQATRGNPCPQNTSEELRDHNCMGQPGDETQATGQSHEVSTTSGNEHRQSADESTQYPANSAAVHVTEEHPQVNYTRQRGSNRCGNRNHLPKHMAGRYGQGNYQPRQSSNRHKEAHFQHLPSNYDSQQVFVQRGYVMDEYGYLSHRPSQANYTHGYDSYYPSPVNSVHTQGHHPSLDMSPPFGYTGDQTVYMYSDLWDDGRITRVHNMTGRWNAGSTRGFCENSRIPSGSDSNSPDATFNCGSSRGSRDARSRSARGTGLVRGNSQRTGRHIPNKNTNGRAFSGGGWEPKRQLKSSLRRCRSVIPLKQDDENVQEAFKYFKKAIEIAKQNHPAALDLGLLLKETDQADKALTQFNSITNNYNPLTDQRLTVITAFEQAGLCYLKLSEITGNVDYKEKAKNKLTKAVSMSADLALIMPELQGSHEEVWVAFTTLLAEIDKEQVPYNRRIKEKIKVLELAREYGDIVDVIQKLKDTGHEELTNPDIIKTALDSYLKLGQLDNALGYHNLVSMNPAVKGSDWWNANPMRSLRVKVLLHAILERLREISDSPTVLFQQLFELVFGSCIGLRDPENDQQHDTAPVVLGDVLFVFDTDDSPDEEMRCPVVKAARCLRTLSTCLFGLDTQDNLKGTGEYGERCSIQLKEMLKYQVVIIVLGDDTRNGLFKALLESVSYNKHEEAPPNQKILVIDAGLQGGKIPQCLQQFKSLRLEDGILDQLQTAPESWGDSDHISFTEIINHVDVDAVLKLFCFMIGQTWPCP